MSVKTPWLAVRVQAAGERIEAQASMAADSPWFDGHFPGNPIFPGLGLLAIVESSAREGLGLQETEWALAELRRVRFRRTLRPGDSVQVSLQASREENAVQAGFSLRCAGEDVGRGMLIFASRGLTTGSVKG